MRCSKHDREQEAKYYKELEHENKCLLAIVIRLAEEACVYEPFDNVEDLEDAQKMEDKITDAIVATRNKLHALKNAKTVYRVRWTQGNGYHCGCCRHIRNTWEDFETLKEAEDQAQRLHDVRDGKIKPEYEDEGDNSDVSIERVELIQKLH